ncbi:cytochrome P450 [Cercophora newfieldiana]|uniref:Cytochrome P450 n=1 Tax=Cercophora newfieldiana TaxID=92897 RepID=A0AA39XZ48_9PEZI|nr:cytochrome P450 [Cercophora newfieldiana]
MEAVKESIVSLFRVVVAEIRTKSTSEVLGVLFALILAPLLSWYALAWMTSPLRGIPGPFFAGWTNLWRLLAVWSDEYPQRIHKLHKRYGPMVRVGPNTVTLDFPELIKTIYGTDGKFPKTEFYASSSAIVDGKLHYTLFAQPDPELHAMAKRPVAKYYTTGAALALEPQMDRAISELMTQLDERFAKRAKPCDLWRWSLYLTWDLSSYIIFSRRFGYLERGSDFDNSIALSAGINSYFQTVGQMPWLDFLLDKNPVMKIGPAPFINLTKIAVDGYTARLTGQDKEFDPDFPDYLQNFINAKAENPDAVNGGAVIAYTLVHIIAGADTTAIVVSSIIYYILSHPDVMSKLVAEVRAAGFAKDKPVAYNAARQLPYLDAVWLEVSRLQPIAGMLYERYVPAEGIALPNGTFIPGGSVIGLNPYITNRNPSVFGPDAEVFRPERWLQLPGEDTDTWNSRLRLQRSVVDMNFGGGSRICLGKNLGTVELYKIVATLVNRYDISLEGDGGWELEGGWVRKPKRLMVRLGIRK